MKVLRIFIFGFFASLMCLGNVYAEHQPEIDVGWVDFEPFFYEKEGVVTGIVLDKFSMIAKRAGYKVNSKIYPMKRLGDFTRNGILDMTILLKVVFQENEVLASDKMLCQIELRDFSIGSKEVIKVKEDLAGKKIGIFRGFTYGGWIDFIKDPDNNVDYYEVSTHEQLFRMLELGRVDHVLDYKNPSSVALDKLKIKDLHYETITKLPVFMLISAKSKRIPAQKIVEDFNEAYAYFLDNGQMHEVD